MAAENRTFDEARIIAEGGIRVTLDNITPEIRQMLTDAGVTPEKPAEALAEDPIYLADVSPEWEAELRRRLQQNKMGEVLP